MSTSDERDQAVKDVTNDLLASKFTAELGTKARVDRSSVDNDRTMQLREVLRDIGRDLTVQGVVPKGMQYLGSLSVHVYKSDILKTVAFATLSALDEMTYDIADGALRELNGTTKESYQRSRQKLRSGF